MKMTKFPTFWGFPVRDNCMSIIVVNIKLKYISENRSQLCQCWSWRSTRRKWSQTRSRLRVWFSGPHPPNVQRRTLPTFDSVLSNLGRHPQRGASKAHLQKGQSTCPTTQNLPSSWKDSASSTLPKGGRGHCTVRSRHHHLPSLVSLFLPWVCLAKFHVIDAQNFKIHLKWVIKVQTLIR